MRILEEIDLEEPIIEEKNNFVGVRFIRASKVLAKEKSTGKVLETLQENMILEFIRENESIKKSQVEKLLDVKDSRARKILAEMVKEKLIVKEGISKSTHYKLKSEVE